MATICLCSFAVFAIEGTELADRLSVVFTMLLTAVAFKIVVADTLPKVAYTTLLDLYLNGLFVSCCSSFLRMLFRHHYFGRIFSQKTVRVGMCMLPCSSSVF